MKEPARAVDALRECWRAGVRRARRSRGLGARPGLALAARLLGVLALLAALPPAVAAARSRAEALEARVEVQPGAFPGRAGMAPDAARPGVGSGAARLPSAAAPAASQVQPGATLTVVRGEVAVSRPDGTAVYPAGTGLTLAVSDIVGTLDRTRAIVTFFTGSEIELGSNTTIVIRRLDRDLLERAAIDIEHVAGATIVRVSSASDDDPGIRILTGDTVAVIRNGEVGHGVDPTTNNVTAVCGIRCGPDGLAFPSAVAFVPEQTIRTLTGRGDRVDQRLSPGVSVWDAMAEAASLGTGPDGGISPPGALTGSSDARGRSQREAADDRDDARPAGAAMTATVTPSLAATATVGVTATPTGTVSAGPSQTPTPSPTLTPSPTPSPSFTAVPTATPPPGTPGPACNVPTTSGGAGTTTTVHNLNRTGGTFRIQYNAFTAPDQFEIFYEGALIFTTGGPVLGAGSADVSYGPGTSTFITVVVTSGAGSTRWTYTITCPP